MAHVEVSGMNSRRNRSLAEDESYCPMRATRNFCHIDQHLSHRFNLILHGCGIFHLVAKQEFHRRPIAAVEPDAEAAFDGRAMLCARHAMASQQDFSYQHVSLRKFPNRDAFPESAQGGKRKRGAIIYD
ncbi:hypothetical protein O0881_20365 [Janthinobacterium sp. SUN100]|uniref:hypothetical protein n=1 Tax=Janthinobacterium sp. SUN100 TaxID=3004101 RepID=UPI0025AF0614|nr:hypothetical protein [Janthinobacterium sp. SUN100]MDN2704337.1 hypothetical protein [Janthinobacterium sp. SUN100]